MQRERQMTVTFERQSTQQLDQEILLKRAVEITCDELIQVYQIDGLKSALLVDIIAYAILEKFKAGERDASLLSTHAVRRALLFLRLKPNRGRKNAN
jgi:hypothetical protein